MRPHTFFAFLAFIVSCLLATTAFSQETVELLIVGGHRFDTEQKVFLPNQSLAIRNGLIVGFDSPPEQFSATKTLELEEDDYVLPGLIDCHAHYNVRLIKRRREEFEVMPILYLANGATSTFSCGEFAPEKMRELRLAIESGDQIGPHLINSGPYFGRARPGWRQEKSEAEIRNEVDYWVEQGVGGFKAKAISSTELKPLVEQAHKHGLTVTGHLGSGYRTSVNPRDAINLGIDRIEHFVGGDAMVGSKSAYDSLPEITRDQAGYTRAVQQFIDTGTVFDATLTAYGYPGLAKEEYEYWIDERQFFTDHMRSIVDQRGTSKPIDQFEQIYSAKLATIGTFFDMGGTLSLGTDHVSDGNYLPGFGVHRELDAFVRAGIPTVDALLIATLNGARALGIDETRGSIEIGKFADLCIIKGDPIKNIRNTRRVNLVVKQGTVYEAEKLLEAVKGKLGPSGAEEEGAW
jgi:imidazolonepropionase-like amidohydrolase